MIRTVPIGTAKDIWEGLDDEERQEWQEAFGLLRNGQGEILRSGVWKDEGVVFRARMGEKRVQILYHPSSDGQTYYIFSVVIKTPE